MAESHIENQGSGSSLGKVRVESTGFLPSDLALKRRNAWKKLHGLQCIFSTVQAILHKSAGEFLAEGFEGSEDMAARYRKAAGHSVRRCGCGVVPTMRKGVATSAPGVARVQQSAGGPMVWTWVDRCASTWFCPVCSGKVMHYRRQELEKGMSVFQKHKFFFAFVTLTIPHKCDVPLLVYMLRLQEVLKDFRAGDDWTRFKAKYGMRGYIRAQEVMYGERFGWHPHYHELLVFEKKPSKKEAAEISAFIKARWLKLCIDKGLVSDDKIEDARQHGVDVRVGGDVVAAKYMSKVVPWEMSSSTTKAARNKTNVHPFQILDKLLEKGTDFQKWAGLWAEYIAGMYRRVAVYWSPGLKNFCGIKEVSDAEALRGEVEPKILLEAMPSGFRRLAKKGKQTVVLELIERDKWDSLWKFDKKILAGMYIPGDEEYGHEDSI